MRCIVVIILILVFTFSCKKEKDISPVVEEKKPDTIKPGNYFPVWPGSWWKYTNKASAVGIDCTAISWQLHQYYNQSVLSHRKLTEAVYIPFFNKKPIYGYKKLIYYHAPFGDYYSLRTFLSEAVGTVISDNDFCDSRNGNPCLAETRTVVAKTVNNKQDSILIVKGRYLYGNASVNQYWIDNPPNEITYREYTKNVGLTLHYVYDTVKKDTTFLRRLVDFKIGVH